MRQIVGEADFDLDVLAELGHIRVDGPRYRITGQDVLAHEGKGQGG